MFFREWFKMHLCLAAACLVMATNAVAANGYDTPTAGASAPLVQRVEATLDALHLIGGNRLDVSSRDGVVTLDGTVILVEDRHRALAAARSVPGVQAVIDSIHVLSTGSGTMPR